MVNMVKPQKSEVKKPQQILKLCWLKHQGAKVKIPIWHFQLASNLKRKSWAPTNHGGVESDPRGVLTLPGGRVSTVLGKMQALNNKRFKKIPKII